MRTYRDNYLPKKDVKRMAKTCVAPEDAAEIKATGDSAWIDLLDELALGLKLISYETKGQYMGYHSYTESYPDNFIGVNREAIDAFRWHLLKNQETLILNQLISHKKDKQNEFLYPRCCSLLSRFSTRGSLCGVMPHIPFDRVRKKLLSVLSQCQPNVWYSTASLIAYMKKNEHDFIISPALLKKARKNERARYYNFTETKGGKEEAINEKDPDAFERVEGRYIERFLEGIPLEMGYVDVAYGEADAPYADIKPSFTELKAFRLNSRFFVAQNQQIAEPKVTVLPNFEVHIDSMFYPAKELSILAPLGDIVTDDVHIVLRLKKQHVAKVVAEHADFDLLHTLSALSSKPIPANIRSELEQWIGHADTFTLYKNAGLLEGKIDASLLHSHLVKQISPACFIVSEPNRLYQTLDKQEYVPVLITHTDTMLHDAPEHSASSFAVKKAKQRASKAPKQLIQKSTVTTLTFPNAKLFDAFKYVLLDNQLSVTMDKKALQFSYDTEHRQGIEKVLKAFLKTHHATTSK